MKNYKPLAVVFCFTLFVLAHVTEGHFRLGREMEFPKGRENVGVPFAPELARKATREERLFDRLESLLEKHEKRTAAN